MKTTFAWTEFVIGPRQLRQAAAVPYEKRDRNPVWHSILEQAKRILSSRGITSPVLMNTYTGLIWFRPPRDRRSASRAAVAAVEIAAKAAMDRP